MSNRNEALEAAIDELRNNGIEYRMEPTKDHHFKIFIQNSPMIVLVSGAKKDRDNIIAKKVRADIRRAIRNIQNGK